MKFSRQSISIFSIALVLVFIVAGLSYQAATAASSSCEIYGIDCPPAYSRRTTNAEKFCGDEFTNPLTLPGRNGWIVFPPNSGDFECKLSSQLPSAALKKLGDVPGGAAATSYLLNIPSSQTYQVCFDTSGVTNPAIYRFVSGEWRLIAAGSINPLCGPASGDGAFALGSE